MSAHTPGPWSVTDSGVRDIGWYICHTNPAQRYEGQDDRFSQESAERVANKLLIAAAPDLLEALKNLCELADGGDVACWTKECDEAISAIAKATGQ